MRRRGYGIFRNRPRADACEVCLRLPHPRLPKLVRAQPIDPYRAALSRGGGLGPRSLALPLSQHSRPTDLELAIVSTMSTPCRSCAINTFVKTRGPLPRSTCSIHQECAKSSPHPHKKTKQNKTKQNKQNKQTGSFSKPWTCHWWETQAGALAPLPGRPALPLPTTVLDSRPTMYW